MTLAFAGQPDRRLTAGMNVEVLIGVADTTGRQGYALPFGSIFLEGETPSVWVFGADSTVRRRAVVLGNTDAEGRAVVVGGLDGGEWVVRAGVSALEEGEKVRVVAEPSQTNVGGLL